MSDQVNALKKELARVREKKREIANIAQFWAGSDDLPFERFFGEICDTAKYGSTSEISVKTAFEHIENMLKGQTLTPLALVFPGEEFRYIYAASDWCETLEDPHWFNRVEYGSPGSAVVLKLNAQPRGEHSDEFRKVYADRFYDHISESVVLNEAFEATVRVLKLPRAMVVRSVRRSVKDEN